MKGSITSSWNVTLVLMPMLMLSYTKNVANFQNKQPKDLNFQLQKKKSCGQKKNNSGKSLEPPFAKNPFFWEECSMKLDFSLWLLSHY